MRGTGGAIFSVAISYPVRRLTGWTQVYFAEITGLGSVYISQLEHGKKEPGLRTIEILAISFELSPSQLLQHLTEVNKPR